MYYWPVKLQLGPVLVQQPRHQATGDVQYPVCSDSKLRESSPLLVGEV